PWTLNGSGSLNCQGTELDVNIWVEPTVTISAVNDTICNGASTNILVSSSNIPTNGIKYTWTVTPGSVNGATANPTGQAIGTSIVQSLTNNSPNKQLVTYHIIPWTLNGSGSLNCQGTELDVNIWVEPTVTISAVNDTICNGASTNILVSSSNIPTNGIKYTWTVTPGSVNGATANPTGQAIGTSIVQSLTNNSPNKQLVTYHIIPWTLNGSGSLNCQGTELDVNIWVEPTVTISAVNDTICNGASTNILVSSSNIPTNGIKYTWTVTPGSVNGATANPTGQAIGTSIVQSLTNNSPNKQLVTYHIIPWTLNGSGSLNCQGTELDVNIWVEPTVTISAVNDTICNGASTNILVSSSNIPTNGIKYTWTVTPGSVNGATANPTGQAIGTSIVQSLTNNSPNKQLVTYHIIPWTLNGSGSLNCQGTELDVNIWVEPTVTISAVNDTICNGASTNILVSSSNIPTNGIKYTWTVTPGSVNGATANPTGQAIGTSIVQSLTNNSPNKQLVTYHIIPWTLNGSGSLNCQGTELDVNIWVEPTVTISAVNDTICNCASTNILVSSSNIPTNGIKYTWTVTPGSVNGATANPTGQAIGTSIVQSLTNNSPNKQLVTYHIIPWTLNGSGSLNCQGTELDVNIWVEPTVTISAVNDTICNGASTNILVSSSNIPTNGIKYTWTVTPGSVNGATANPTGQAIGTSIVQSLTNNSPNKQLVTYHIIPWTLNGSGSLNCQGTELDVNIWVEPTVTISAVNDTICNCASTNILVSSSNIPTNGIKYTWTVTPGSVNGATANPTGQAIGTSIVQSLTNNSPNKQLVTYHIIPWTLNGSGSLNCQGTELDVNIWVEPTVTISAVNDTICNCASTNILVSSSNIPTNGIKYTWTVTPGSVNGATANPTGQAIGTSIVQSLTNNSPNKQLVTYHIIPWTLNGSGSLNCQGTELDVNIWVEPTVTISAVNDTICNCASTNILVSSSNIPTNGIKYTWTVTPGSVNGATANPTGQAIGTSIVQSLTNNSPNKQLVTYHIIPWTLNGSGSLNCQGTELDVNIWVEPTVTISAVNDTICNGASTNILVSSSNIPTNGIKYTWTVTPGSVNGATANPTGQAIGTSIVQSLTNNSPNKQLVTYHIIPWTLNGSGSLNCQGTELDVNIWVEPTVTISAVNDTICNGASTNILVSSSNIPTNGIKYTWTVTPGSVNGATANPTGQAIGTSIVQSLTNNSPNKQLVTYHIIPWTLNGSGSLNCQGTELDVNIWVEPTVTISAVNDTICNGASTNILVSSSNIPTNGIKYTWTVTPGSVNGATANPTGQAIGTSIVQSLTNNSPNKQLVTYHIIPWTLNGSGSLNCQGTELDVNIWVEPTVTISAVNDTICNGASTNILVSSSNIPTNGIKYTWT